MALLLLLLLSPTKRAPLTLLPNTVFPSSPSVEKLLAADLKLDAASVAVPTVHHCAVASELLAAGLDLLIEKPLAASLNEADELIALAETHQSNHSAGPP